MSTQRCHECGLSRDEVLQLSDAVAGDKADQPVCCEVEDSRFDPPAEEEQLITCDFANLDIAMQEALWECSHFNTSLDQCGEQGENAYETLAKNLRGWLREVEELRTHEHQWNADLVCSICGADGAA